MIALHAPRLRVDRVDAAFAGTAIMLALASLVAAAWPSLSLRVVAPALDLALDTIALVVTTSVATLAWVRYRERRETFALYEVAAFLAFAVADGAAVLHTVAMRSDSTLTIVEPGQEQLVVFAGAHLVAAALLVVGGVQALRGRQVRHPGTIVAGTVVAVLTIAVVANLNLTLPPLISLPAGPHGAPVMTSLGGAVHLAGAVLFGIAAWMTRLIWRRDGATGDKFVAFGLMLAAFAQLHAAAIPGTHPGPVTSADVLRLGFDLVLLLAIEAEARSVLAALRRANQTLEDLRTIEVERAALGERERLSRELHDGLAQALWLAKLKIARLSSDGTLTDDARQLAGDAAAAVELGLAEARQAVLAMRIAADTEASFCSLMDRYLEDHADRFGLVVEFDCDPNLPALPARTQAELLRIAQEALSNVRRHAAASRVTVRARRLNDEIALSIIDDGRGFRPAVETDTGFGLSAMRERAGLIGGRLAIRSEPGLGTEVLVTAPIGPSPQSGGTHA
ncbi:MAG TPA: sensor histidine kinase [Candidatus Limnocylindrales bacterium]|nr:sensor histidine kinase [Candidatus Limnocylindrales bacterium]